MLFEGPCAQKSVSEAANLLHKNAWVANHDGNVSLRLSGEGRFLATPTAISKRIIKPQDLVTVNLEGRVLSGRKRLFSEWHLHAACYKARNDVRAVLHAHPPYATAFSIAQRELGEPALPEIVVSLGKNIPLISYQMPKNASQNDEITLALKADKVDAMLIAANGVLTVGAGLEQAYLRMELLEHYAKILYLSQSLGGAVALPSEDVHALMQKRD